MNQNMGSRSERAPMVVKDLICRCEGRITWERARQRGPQRRTCWRV